MQGSVFILPIFRSLILKRTNESNLAQTDNKKMTVFSLCGHQALRAKHHEFGFSCPRILGDFPPLYTRSGVKYLFTDRLVLDGENNWSTCRADRCSRTGPLIASLPCLQSKIAFVASIFPRILCRLGAGSKENTMAARLR